MEKRILTHVTALLALAALTALLAFPASAAVFWDVAKHPQFSASTSYTLINRYACPLRLESYRTPVGDYDYHYADADSFTVGNAEVDPGNVSRLVIDWVAGQVTVEPYDGDTISVSEPMQAKEKNRLRWRQEGDTLTIRYCASTGSGDAASKDLTVRVPADLAEALRYVQIDTVSADAYVHEQRAQGIL